MIKQLYIYFKFVKQHLSKFETSKQLLFQKSIKYYPLSKVLQTVLYFKNFLSIVTLLPKVRQRAHYYQKSIKIQLITKRLSNGIVFVLIKSPSDDTLLKFINRHLFNFKIIK